MRGMGCWIVFAGGDGVGLGFLAQHMANGTTMQGVPI